jgi:hypothetical protein
MNRQNLFLLISQLYLGIYVIANPIVETFGSVLGCDLDRTYDNKVFNLYTDRVGGTQLSISPDGQVQASADIKLPSYPLTGKFDSKNQGKNSPQYGNLLGMNSVGKWNQYGYLSVLNDPKVSGGDYAFRFSAKPGPNQFLPGVLFKYKCNNGSPILVATNAKDGSQFMGCTIRGGSNVCSRPCNYVSEGFLMLPI